MLKRWFNWWLYESSLGECACIAVLFIYLLLLTIVGGITFWLNV